MSSSQSPVRNRKPQLVPATQGESAYAPFYRARSRVDPLFVSGMGREVLQLLWILQGSTAQIELAHRLSVTETPCPDGSDTVRAKSEELGKKRCGRTGAYLSLRGRTCFGILASLAVCAFMNADIPSLPQ